MDEEEFHSHFRVKKATFKIISDAMHEYRETHKGLDHQQRTLIGLWYVANHSSYRLISQQFGIAMSTAYDTVYDFIEMLNSKKEEYIKLPTAAELQLNAQLFSKYGFPNVYGALDGSSINVVVPAQSKGDYTGRKNCTALNVTVLCNAEKKFLNAMTGYSARCHDSHIFQCSRLGALTYNGHIPRQYHIVADAAYGLHTNIMVPYSGNDLNPAQERYNKLHSSTRIVVERSFSDLKNRFLRLKYLECDIEFATKVIMACCVLHNICIDNGDISSADTQDQEQILGNVTLHFTTPAKKRDAISRLLTPDL